MSLNEAAFRLAEPLLADPEAFGAVRHEIGGATVIDCGARAAGGAEAGLVLAHVALAGRGSVTLAAATAPADAAAGPGPDWPGCPWPTVSVSSGDPVAACLAAQYAGWKVSTSGYFAMASGPVRAAIGRERVFDAIGLRERPPVAVGLLESARLPPAEVCRQVAADAGVRPADLVLLVARTASPAGTLQVVARSLETALHKLHDLGFDVGRVAAGEGRAPLPPLPARSGDDLTAIGRTNDAILYGGWVRLEIEGDEAEIREIGPRAVSAGSPSHGRPFLELFEEAGRDFYALDPALFAPATIELVSRTTGRRWRFGQLRPDVLADSFGDPGSQRQPALT